MSSTAPSLLFFGDQAQPARTHNELLSALRRRATPLTPHLYAFSNQRLDDVVDGGHHHNILEWAHMLASQADETEEDPITSALVPCIAQLGSLIWYVSPN